MADKGVIFSAPMVRALLDGRKTQTRRLATSPLRNVQIGDRLWVRESYRLGRQWDDFKAREADQSTRVWPEVDRDNCDAHGKLRPSIFMPRWASRLTLIVTDVRRQQLQDIDEADALSEGAEYGYAQGAKISQRRMFQMLWDSLHVREGERWQDNPSIVALSFDVHHRNIDAGGVS